MFYFFIITHFKWASDLINCYFLNSERKIKMDINDTLDGKFRSRQTYFTSISSEVLENKKLSLNAKGLYALIQSCISFSKEDVTKASLMKKCKKSAAAFFSCFPLE